MCTLVRTAIPSACWQISRPGVGREYIFTTMMMMSAVQSMLYKICSTKLCTVVLAGDIPCSRDSADQDIYDLSYVWYDEDRNERLKLQMVIFLFKTWMWSAEQCASHLPNACHTVWPVHRALFFLNANESVESMKMSLIGQRALIYRTEHGLGSHRRVEAGVRVMRPNKDFQVSQFRNTNQWVMWWPTFLPPFGLTYDP